MMKKLVGNVVSMLMEALMWITLIACVIGGAVFGYSQVGIGGAFGGLVVGALAGMLLNTMWWLISVIQEIRNYSKNWVGKYKTKPESSIPKQDSNSPTSIRMPDFQRILASYGKKIIISMVSLALLAGIIVLAKNFASSNTEEKKSEKTEKIEEPIESFGFKTVKMPDGKIWMAENLNVEIGKSTCYENDESKCNECGRLYDWATAMKACPSGWHLPTNAEWTALGNAIGSADKYGFSSRPCGRHFDGKFLHYGSLAFFWTATETDSKNAMASALDASGANLDVGNLSKAYLRSVRCVRGD